MAKRAYKLAIELTDAERSELESWARRRKTAQALALRARIVLLCATGKTHLAIAEQLKITNVTVGKWRQRFAEKRIEGLLDEPRPGKPRKITDVERVIMTTLEQKPKHATHWTTRSMAKAVGAESNGDRPYLESLWPAATPTGDVQDF